MLTDPYRLPRNLMNDKVAASRLTAFGNIVAAINFDMQLPQQMFFGSWSQFLFFETDRMFCTEFTELLNDFIRAEKSHVCCLFNYSKSKELGYEQAAQMFIDNSVSGAEYESRLRGSGPSEGWLYSMDRYGCASDRGRWCIYCERTNDVGVVALRYARDQKDFSIALRKLNASPIQALLRGGCDELFPFNCLVPDWEAGLVANYSSPPRAQDVIGVQGK